VEKLSSVFIGVVDFFAALLPGAATVAVLLAVAPNAWTAELASYVTSEELQLLALIGAGYIVGQVMNSVGSYALDVVYDAFYAPDHGILVGVTDAPGWRGMLAKVHGWRFPLGAFISGVIEKDTEARAEKLGLALDTIAGPAPTRGVYGRIRAYCSIALPTAFEQIERLESEQKFFRTATVASVLIGIAMHRQGYTGTWIWLLAAFLLTRYISRRRKTIERAYLFFGLRDVAAALRASPAGEPPAAQVR
jgi:hypothetical protein